MPTKINDESVYVLLGGEFCKLGYVTDYDLDISDIENDASVLVANPFDEVSLELTIDRQDLARLTRIFGFSNNYRRYHGMRAIRWRKICRR